MLRRAFLVVTMLTYAGCEAQPSGPEDTTAQWGGLKAGAVDQRLVDANNTFGFKLLLRLSDGSRPENVFISPTSVAIALTMTYNGASGTTQTEMARALELEGMTLDEINAANGALRTMLADSEPAIQLNIANSLWAREGIPFEDEFLNRNREYFAAEITAMNFADPDAASVINSWVDDKTRGAIDRIVSPPIDAATVLFLINAIYFKGTWTYQFDPEATREAPFYLADGGRVTVPMMAQGGTHGYLRADGFQAVRLPYGSGRAGMYIFLPDAGMGLDGFQNKLNKNNWDNWMSLFSPQDVDLFLPRFRLEYEESLVSALSQLGMAGAFTAQADFRAMASLPVMISDVRHKTFLDVNEEGTEAAAVTSVEIVLTSEPMQLAVRVDRPFFCAIVDDETGAILFMGAIYDPS